VRTTHRPAILWTMEFLAGTFLSISGAAVCTETVQDVMRIQLFRMAKIKTSVQGSNRRCNVRA